jgi:chemotaxis protein MotA
MEMKLALQLLYKKVQGLSDERGEMDITTIIGAGVGVVLFVGNVVLLCTGAGLNPITTFFDPASIMIVIGGTAAAILINFPLNDVVGVIPVVRNTFVQKTQSASEVIAQFEKYAKVARREGILSLEKETENIDDEFLRKGLQLAVDGTEQEMVTTILETDLQYLRERHKMGQSIFMQGGYYAPAFGMIGTLMGLIVMLGNLAGGGGINVEQIGIGMAVALITTLYGAIFANLVLLPLGGKLKNRSIEEELIKELVIEGIASLQAGENPRMLTEKLKAFLKPSDRERLVEDEEGSF